MFGSKAVDGVAPGFIISHGAGLSKQPKLTIRCRDHNGDSEGRKTNLYKVLSLESETVGADEIKKAYRRMALRWHPDACSPSRKEESTRMFVELHRAYETLSDPVLRWRYDNNLGMEKQERWVRPVFYKETWEAQLQELRKRSDVREKAGWPRSSLS